MNFTKSLLAFGLASTLLFSCKDTASKPIAGSDETNTKKEVAVAAKPECPNPHRAYLVDHAK